MEGVDVLIKLGSLAAALTALIVLVKNIVNLCKKLYDFIHTLDTNVSTLIKHDNAQYLAILRLTITNEGMPISERLKAGEEYIEKGGNGDVSKLYMELKSTCEQAIEDSV